MLQGKCSSKGSGAYLFLLLHTHDDACPQWHGQTASTSGGCCRLHASADSGGLVGHHHGRHIECMLTPTVEGGSRGVVENALSGSIGSERMQSCLQIKWSSTS
jgi:hypothetical protein